MAKTFDDLMKRATTLVIRDRAAKRSRELVAEVLRRCETRRRIEAREGTIGSAAQGSASHGIARHCRAEQGKAKTVLRRETRGNRNV